MKKALEAMRKMGITHKGTIPHEILAEPENVEEDRLTDLLKPASHQASKPPSNYSSRTQTSTIYHRVAKRRTANKLPISPTEPPNPKSARGNTIVSRGVSARLLTKN